MIGICNDLLSMPKYSYVRMICGAVYHGDNGKCCSDSVMKYSYGGIYDEIWNDFCVSYGDYDFNICEDVTVILICYVCICPSVGV